MDTSARVKLDVPEQEASLDRLASHLSSMGIGVTVSGANLTVRFGKDEEITLLVTEVDNGVRVPGTHTCASRGMSASGPMCEFLEWDPAKDACTWCGEPDERK